MAAELLFLLCSAALLCTAAAQEPYNELPAIQKKGVDLALEQLTSHPGVQHHFRFWKSLDKSEIEGGFKVKYLYHHFSLKPTRCAKGTAASSGLRCQPRNDRPLMDCAVCYKTLSDEIDPSTSPYVHCIQRPRLTQEMRTTRLEHCRKMSYNSGAPTLLASSTG